MSLYIRVTRRSLPNRATYRCRNRARFLYLTAYHRARLIARLARIAPKPGSEQ